MRSELGIDRDQPVGIRLPAKLLSGLVSGPAGLWRGAPRGIARAWWLALVLGVVGLAIGVAVAVVVWRDAGDPAGGTAVDAGAAAQDAEIAPRDLVPLLTRYGVGPGETGIELTYAPQAFFELAGIAAPAEMDSRPTMAFFMQEDIHEGELAGEPPPVFLELRGDRVAPYSTQVTADDPHHRTTRLLFPQPDGWSTEREQTLTLVVPRDGGAVSAGNTFTWNLPLDLPMGEATQPADQAEAASAPSDLGLSTLTKSLRKTEKGAGYGGVEGVEVGAIYATADYFEAAFPSDAAARYDPQSFVSFVFTETAHTNDLPDELPPLVLRIGGQDYQPDLQERKISSPHHRVSLVRFPAETSLAQRPGVMQLLLPDGSSLEWMLPIAYGRGGLMSPFGVPWVTILALLGGFLASMWPCLFQLTVYFIPMLAGVSMREASGDVKVGRRLGVAKAAFFFVLGFTIVYTAAGALIGFTAQQLQDTSAFETWQRYLGVGAGLVILVLAVRVAAKARAPLVCKMPVLSGMARKEGSANPLELMLAGLAFATGCMTCFGSALVIGMVVYVGLSNSALYGAFILFVFSLGMGIPLAIAAVAMAKVLPLLFRLEKAVPWMALASSALMVAFAVLLITGNYMAVSEWIYRLNGLAQ